MTYETNNEIKIIKLTTVDINTIWIKLSAESYMKQALIVKKADSISNENHNIYYNEDSLDYHVLRQLVEAIVCDQEVTPLVTHFSHKNRNYDILTNKLIQLYIKEGKVTL